MRRNHNKFMREEDQDVTITQKSDLRLICFTLKTSFKNGPCQTNKIELKGRICQITLCRFSWMAKGCKVTLKSSSPAFKVNNKGEDSQKLSCKRRLEK